MMAVRDRQRITQSPFYIKDVEKKKEKFKLHFPARSVPSIGGIPFEQPTDTAFILHLVNFPFFYFFSGNKIKIK
jgi:hypothetical protein